VDSPAQALPAQYLVTETTMHARRRMSLRCTGAEGLGVSSSGWLLCADPQPSAYWAGRCEH